MASPSTAKRPSRLGLILPFALVLIAAIGWSAWWYIAGQRVNEAVDKWISEQRADGVEISYDARTFGGYPFRFELAFDNPVMADGDNAASWRGERAEFVMQAWNLQHMIGRSPGHNVVTGANGIRNTIDLDGKAAFSLSWNRSGVRRFGLQSGKASALLGGSAYQLTDLSLNLAPRPESPDDLMFALQWEGIGIEEAPASAPYLGTELGPSRLIGEVRGFFPALSDASGGERPGRVWEALLENGGGVEVAQLLLDWGPLDLGAKADLTLANGVVNGTLDLRLEDADGLRQAMIASGHWDDGEQLVVGALEATSDNGGFLSLSVRDSEVFLGPFRIGRLPAAES